MNFFGAIFCQNYIFCKVFFLTVENSGNAFLDVDLPFSAVKVSVLMSRMDLTLSFFQMTDEFDASSDSSDFDDSNGSDSSDGSDDSDNSAQYGGPLWKIIKGPVS